MKSLNESILSSNNADWKGTRKKLSEKISRVFEGIKAPGRDALNQKLEVGDIVITIDTTNTVVGCVTNKKDPNDEGCIIIYVPRKGREISIYAFKVIKLENPEELIK